MKGRSKRALFGICIAGFLLWSSLATADHYADPDGDFALRPPEGWQTARSPLAENAWITTFTKGGAAVAIVAFRSAQDLDPSTLEGAGDLLIAAALEEIGRNGSVLSKSVNRVESTVPGASGAAVRCDLEFTSARVDGARQRGTILAMLGKRVAFLVSMSAPLGDGAGSQQAEDALKTLALESRTPASRTRAAEVQRAPSGTAPPVSSLARVAQQFGGKTRREDRGKVLVPGNPPLTYGSVAAFAELVGECFSIQLTEAEFQATQDRFVEYFKKSDTEGKAILAQGWTKLLNDIRSTPPQKRAAALQEVRAVMEDRFRTGATAGIGYAAVMVEAIDKRSKSVAKPSAQKPAFATKQGFDADFSQADLETATEMLYFMWVAAGRDPALVTPQVVGEVQVSIVQGYAIFPPDLQYVLANAQQIYAGLRAQWEEAGDLQRLQMGQVFGQQLDALGFTLPAPRRQGGDRGGAWSDWEGKSHAQFAGEMVVGLAGSSYKSAW